MRIENSCCAIVAEDKTVPEYASYPTVNWERYGPGESSPG